MKISSILVISDKQDKAQKALAHAKLMVERFGAKLHVVAFSYERLQGLSPKLDEIQLEAVKSQVLSHQHQWLNEQISKFELNAHASSEVVWEKDIASWVKQHGAEHQYDLLLKTGHRSEGMFYVPTDWHLMRNGEIPVLLVAEKKWSKKRSIMVSLDMATKVKSKQALNHKLIDAGVMLSAATGMPLHCCFCMPISPILKDLGVVKKSEVEAKAKQQYLPQINQLLGEHQIPEKQIHIRAGETKKIIPSVASSVAAELVIIGSVGRKGVKAKLLGNTAEEVLALLKTDVLVMQP